MVWGGAIFELSYDVKEKREIPCPYTWGLGMRGWDVYSGDGVRTGNGDRTSGDGWGWDDSMSTRAHLYTL